MISRQFGRRHLRVVGETVNAEDTAPNNGRLVLNIMNRLLGTCYKSKAPAPTNIGTGAFSYLTHFSID